MASARRASAAVAGMAVLRVLLAVTLAGGLTGCMGQILVSAASMVVLGTAGVVASGVKEVKRQAAEDEQAAIGNQSAPMLVPQVGDLRLAAYPLNSKARRGQAPFVVCVVPEVSGGLAVRSQMTVAALYPAQILLTLPDRSTVRPSAYALTERCPYPELSESSRVAPEFHAIDFARPLVWRRGAAEPVAELALRFDIAAPDPDENFSLDLGTLALNGVQHTVPTIKFDRRYGPISRATSQGEGVPDQSEPTVAPQIGSVSLWAYPLNASDRQGRKPFVICVVPDAPDGRSVILWLGSVRLDPQHVVLDLPGQAGIRPSGYAVVARCPYPEQSGGGAGEPEFQPVDPGRPLVWKHDVRAPFRDLALRFDVAAPDPGLRFSLDLGTAELDRGQLALPKILFQRSAGPIRRASSQGFRTPDERALQGYPGAAR